MRYALFAACAALVFCAIAALPQKVAFADGKNYTFYCGTSSADCREVHPAVNPDIAKLTLRDVCGESAEYSGKDVEQILKEVNGKILFCENLEDSQNYYCSADLPYSITLYGKEVNLHICVKKEGVKVGTPIIFGGY